MASHEHKDEKTRYRVTNWSGYNQSLINRGNITLWFSKEFLSQWHHTQTVNRRGYSDTAIECVLMLKAVFKLPLRATQGFAQSLVTLTNACVQVPNFSTLSRRQGSLCIDLKPQQAQGKRHVVVDSTGISKRRTWRKLHYLLNLAF